MSNDSNNTKLLLTAVGAAVAGAAVGAAVTALLDRKRKPVSPRAAAATARKTSSLVFTRTGGTDEDLSENAILYPHQHEEKMRRRIAARAAVEDENTLPRDSVTVRVPASSANMGPGCT
jgi:homoserine kinase